MTQVNIAEVKAKLSALVGNASTERRVARAYGV